MKTGLIFEKTGLLFGNNVTFSNEINAFVSDGYTSMAGNTYFTAIHSGNGIVIKEDIGKGYSCMFLNGIKIYSATDKILIAEKTLRNVIYSTNTVKILVVDLLFNMLKQAAHSKNLSFNEYSAIKQIENIVDGAINGNQEKNKFNQINWLLGK